MIDFWAQRKSKGALAILDPLDPGPGEGVGGGVNPSTGKGKEVVWKSSPLNHLTQGWWDLITLAPVGADFGVVGKIWGSFWRPF